MMDTEMKRQYPYSQSPGSVEKWLQVGGTFAGDRLEHDAGEQSAWAQEKEGWNLCEEAKEVKTGWAMNH